MSQIRDHSHPGQLLGMRDTSKTDEFSEKFQTAFDPPPSFSENHIAIFSEIQDRSIIYYNGTNLQYRVSQKKCLIVIFL